MVCELSDVAGNPFVAIGLSPKFMACTVPATPIEPSGFLTLLPNLQPTLSMCWQVIEIKVCNISHHTLS
jgi:hypothetical protein